jgi:hypothetical protein
LGGRFGDSLRFGKLKIARSANRLLSGWFGRLLRGALYGIIVGMLAGAFVIAPIMTARDPMADTVFHSKVEAWHQSTAVILGIRAGAMAGVAAVLIQWAIKRWRQTDT